MDADRVALERACEALREGVIDGNEFVRRTRQEWRKTAAYLHAHWRRKLPQFVEMEDIEQELIVLALGFVREWDPTRGTTIGKFVRWAAIHRTQRQINRWRGASIHGNEGRNEGRPEVTFTKAFGPDNDFVSRVGGPDAEQQSRMESLELYDRVMGHCITVEEVVSVQAVWRARGMIAGAAAAILESKPARTECSVDDVSQATRVVETSLRRIGRRMTAEEDGVMVAPPEDLWDADPPRQSGTMRCLDAPDVADEEVV